MLDKGIGHNHIKARTPRLNGKVGRSHLIEAEDSYRLLLDGALMDDREDSHNYHRPHGGLGGQGPYERHAKNPDPPLNRLHQLHK